jgi:hypothetical protein
MSAIASLLGKNRFRVADAWQRGIAWREVPPYILAQIAGASRHARSGSSQVFSEFVATRIARGYLGLRSLSIVSRPIRRCCIHYGCILVYCFDLVCESGRDLGEIYERYICRY